MWLKRLKEKLFEWILSKRKQLPNQEEIVEQIDIEAETEKLEEEMEKFRVDNVIFEKLDYLQQYIKIFSLTFPEEYAAYLNSIRILREEYELELKKYKDGLEGLITFSIDPEKETNRYIEVARLEDDIRKFVEMDVNYKLYKEKFCKLCSKLNTFYNVLLENKVKTEAIARQIDNAIETLSKIVDEVKGQEFFERDSRKKDEILSCIMYSEYIIFKCFLRNSVINSFAEYRVELSVNHKLFVSQEYDRLMFKFLIEDLERIQLFITSNLNTNSMYAYILLSCQELQNKLDDYTEILDNYEYFQKVIKLENTLYDVTSSSGMAFSVELPNMLAPIKGNEEFVSVKSIAIAILNLLHSDKAKLLLRIINDFKVEISWREFFFLCKVFEIYDEMVTVSSNTIFTMIKEKFKKLEAKYIEYTDSYIQKKKDGVLNSQISKSNKYILLLKVEEADVDRITGLLENLSLDFTVVGNEVYLNHMYFNGFKNLEQNFGAYKTF